jgi:hypothetical protein
MRRYIDHAIPRLICTTNEICMFSFQCPFRFRTSNLFLQPVWCRELVVTTRATHCNPQCQRITPDLLFCRASGGRSGYRHGDRNRCLAVVATSSVHVNRLNAGAIGGCAVSHAGTAKIAGLAVQEGLREVVVLERLHGPGGAVMGSGIGRLKDRMTYRRIISAVTTSTQVISSENLPVFPFTVVAGTSLTRMLAWWNIYLLLCISK